MSIYHEIIEALNPLVNAFDQIGILYYIGGSVSSSLHGIPRRTQDVDVIADIHPYHVHRLVQVLQNDYYVDEQAFNDAVRRGLPYNVIHLDTMMKIDLMPLKRRAFTQEEARRAQDHVLEDGTRPLRIAAAEDAILTKLEWFNMGGRMSSRQWSETSCACPRTTPHEKAYTEARQDPGEKTTKILLWNNVQSKLYSGVWTNHSMLPGR